MSAVVELDLPEYPQGFMTKYKYFFGGEVLFLTILFYINCYILGLLSLLLMLVLVYQLNRRHISKQIVLKEICDKKALFAEIREISFFGSYLFKRTIVPWKDVEIASIMPLQIRPTTFFLLIRGRNFSLRTHFNVDIEYTDSKARQYWYEIEKILTSKSKKYDFELEVTDLLSTVIQDTHNL